MERNRHTKNIIIVVLLISVLSLSIAFSIFSQTLKIEGTANVTSNTTNWNIAFDEITTLNTTGYATGTSNRNTEQDITFNCEFADSNDTCELSATIVNKGSINALYKGATLTVSSEEIGTQDVSETYNDGIIAVNLVIPTNWNEDVTILKNGESGKFSVQASLIDISVLDSSTKYTVTVKFNFEQSENE